MSYFDNIFLDTTDPYTSYNRLIQFDIMVSIITHVMLYVGFIYLFCFIFEIQLSDEIYNKIIRTLGILMILGYYGRLTRSKMLFNAFIDQGYNKEESYLKSTQLIRNAYYTFYFLA